VSGTSEVGGPGFCGVHHLVIHANWKENELACFVFPLTGCLSFTLNPNAMDRGRREDEQQLVM